MAALLAAEHETADNVGVLVASSTGTTEKSTLVKANADRRIFKPRVAFHVQQIPDEILNDADLNAAVAEFPASYTLEIPKTIWRIRKQNAKRVALQFPEGLQMFAVPLAELIKRFTGAETVILGDVTYGACCVDDFTARDLGADLLVHYGHSCLIPVDVTSEQLQMLYVFVSIQIDIEHLINTIVENFPDKFSLGSCVLVSTIQFVTSLHLAADILRKKHEFDNLFIPQSKPLSPGEILGCTSPHVKDASVLIYVGDGRFHLESAMIANPHLTAYRYDPYSKRFTRELYDHAQMLKTRSDSILRATNATTFGLILGTLGRQGSPEVFRHLEKRLKACGKRVVKFMMSEVFPAKLDMFPEIEAWVQTSCPRLSIDWGAAFNRPLLSPYELSVVLHDAEFLLNEEASENGEKVSYYPMDFYANESLGPWTPKNAANRIARKVVK